MVYIHPIFAKQKPVKTLKQIGLENVRKFIKEQALNASR